MTFVQAVVTASTVMARRFARNVAVKAISQMMTTMVDLQHTKTERPNKRIQPTVPAGLKSQRLTIALTLDELCKLAALSPAKKNGKPNYSEGVRHLIRAARG
jgi:hypothetical protein